MFTMPLKRTIFCCAALLLFMLTACNTQKSANSSGNNGNANTPISRAAQPVATSTSHATSSSGIPIVILSPTPVSGGGVHSQMVTLPDRTLIINNVSKQPGADASSTAIVLMLTIKNTSTNPIMNEASFFQLIGAEGDIFGLQSSTTSSFFGSIGSKSWRSGAIVFQVPTAAIESLRLLYRSEVATETVFVSLNV